MACRSRTGRVRRIERVNLSSLAPRPRFLPVFKAWKALRGLRIGITGHRGILGSLLTARLAKEGIEFAVFIADVGDEQAVSRWIDEIRPDVMFHLAAIVPIKKVQADPVAAMRVNGISNLFMIDAIARYVPSCWLFYSSTSHVYAPQNPVASASSGISEGAACEPLSLYGATKLVGERVLCPLATHYQVSACIGRIFSYFHENQSTMFLVPNLLQRVAQSRPGAILEVPDSSSIRDLLYADFIIDAILHLCVGRYAGIVNIGSGHGMTVGAIADQIVSLSGKHLTINRLYSDLPTSLVANVSRLRAAISS